MGDRSELIRFNLLTIVGQNLKRNVLPLKILHVLPLTFLQILVARTKMYSLVFIVYELVFAVDV